MMKVRLPLFGLLAAASLFAATAEAITLQLSANSTVSSNPVEADYSSTHLFIDEINGDSIPIFIYFDPQSGSTVDEADVFTNLNNRDLANVSSSGNGIPDGIVPPNGNYILSSSTTPSYYQAYKMNGSGPFTLVLYANKTGAYRITARYHVQGDPANTFHWYSDFVDGNGLNYRDAAIVVSPTKARQIVMYEMNALSVNANAPANDNDYTQRSTFDDIDGGPNATTGRPCTLSYLQGMGVNWLWMQPIHPIGVQGRQSDPNESNAPFSVGSPYSVEDFFQVNPLYSKTYVPGTTSVATGESNAMVEFQRFVKAADAAGINIMLDVPFNHTSYDCEFGAMGQALFGNANTSATTQFEDAVANFYSRWNGENISGANQFATDLTDLSYFDFGARAYDAGSIALAADRFDFAKFVDVHDVYFGNYSSLVDLDDSGNYDSSDSWENKYLSEADAFDYSIGANNVSNDALDAYTNSGNGHFDTVTQNVWKYFAWYIPYWLQQTGHVDANGNLVGNSTLSDPVARRAADDTGLDGIRADFAQGLPPQCWEYIMNYARSYKWDLVFLAESLDGGNVTYRSSRHFDVVNDSVLFDLYGDQQNKDFRSTYEARRDAYGQGLVIWDTESHDEAGYNDPYQALIRYAADSTIDGVPDIFYGQEIGISGAVQPPNSNNFLTPYGFTNYQVNFGKPIPNFMCYNSLADAWNALGPDAYGQAQLYPVYAAIGSARANSPALQSSNRYFLDDTGSNTPPNIFGVAKYASANQSPNLGDVVFGFVNLQETSGESDVFNVNIVENGSNLFGIDPNRTYNVKNIAADTEYDSSRNSVWLWGSVGRTGSDVLANGIYVALNAVPTGTSGWVSSPYEAQYLKLYDITPPPTPGAPATPNAYSIGNSTTFTWNAATDSEGGIAGYQVVVSTQPNGGGAIVYSGSTSANSVTVTGTYGQSLYAMVTTINNAGVYSTSSANSAGATLLLDPNGDQNGCGLTNAQQDAAGFSPLDNLHWFHITAVTPVSGGTQISWQSIPGRTYQVEYSSGPATGYAVLSGTITASGTSSSYTDVSGGGSPRFYEVTTPYQ
ncbi:MAG TPA: alpha-amylase family glycosyl hydrolase [Chthoniobacteraceae bacterium]|jgi:glycosidase|nr:alpha-amylase family glycosyl hydrolase [Chthoniobacteraceae bacterium]